MATKRHKKHRQSKCNVCASGNSLWLIRLIVFASVLAGLAGFLLTHNAGTPPVHAFSAGPPAGYTGAPNEEPEACAECHVPPDAGTGQISITAPPTYVPGQTYPITVTHTNPDPTRLRWGFELTVLDTASDEKAGELQSPDGLTQVLNNAGPGSARQYIEHTAAGTFIGQQNSASWTFNWTAPPIDVGPVVFYAAGNQANNDGNTSGDYIYKTFVASAPASSTPDFALSVNPTSRNALPGSGGIYTITVTPLAGFTGQVNFGLSNFPAGASIAFNPISVNITDASSKTTRLTLTTGQFTPVNNYTFNIDGQSGAISHSIPASLNIVSPTSADLSITSTASPNPGQAGVNLSYRIIVTNHGPKPATSVIVGDNLPPGVTFVSATATQGNCNDLGQIICNLGTLDIDSSAIVTVVVIPSSAGQITNTVSVGGNESDSDSTNNTASTTTVIQPAASTPTMLDDNLTVSTVIAGLDQPTSMTFIGMNDFFVLERATGKVQRVVNGSLHSTPLDLAVNNASERGLLGIALHPSFAQNGFVYLYWTESTTGSDTANIDQVPILGNRVDRYVWNGTALTFDRNLIKLRAFQQDAGQPSRGNHNGGVLRFGPDGKLYIIFGDNGRRGFLQNLVQGGPNPDDQFGGPEPDDAHLTGVILRLNDDGSTPADNPFFNALPPTFIDPISSNIRKIFAYGIRNSFGMDFDPLSGALWTQENGDDAFDEINRVTPGFNGGWIQAMGPVSRVDEFRSIEMSYGAGNLQQIRWPPSNIQTLPQQALIQMSRLPGAQYVDPEFSWKYAVAPSPIGFVKGRGLGPQFEGDLFVGASRTTLLNGFLFRFKLNADRQHFDLSDPRLADRVADNLDKFDQTESESLLIGRDFGITTDIQTGPNGNVFVVSLSNGAVYEIKSKPRALFVATLTGAQETPSNNSTATGRATLLLSPDEKTARVSLVFSGLSSAQTDAHIHGPAAPGVSAPPVFPLPLGQLSDFQISMTPARVQDLKNGLLYINVHSSNFPAGEIRGQFGVSPSAQSVQFGATSYIVNENAGSLTVNVTRIGDTSNAATINFATSNGTATQPGDYTNSSGSVQFAAGETVKSFVVPIINDETIERPESINIVLSSSSSGVMEGSPFTSTITIIDDDKPLIVTEENTGRAVALDSVTLAGEPFPLTNIHNFSVDQRTRVVLFASGIDLMPNESISVQIEDILNRSYPLVVEDVRKVPNFDWLTQIVVKLPDSIDIEGDYRISLTFRGTTGNKASISIIR